MPMCEVRLLLIYRLLCARWLCGGKIICQKIMFLTENVVNLHRLYNQNYSFFEKEVVLNLVEIMNVETIGNWAGLVWVALNGQGKLGVKGIKKATKLKEKEIYAALGWLAREGKVSIEEAETDVMVALV